VSETHLITRVGKGHGADLVLLRQRLHRPLDAQVPYLPSLTSLSGHYKAKRMRLSMHLQVFNITRHLTHGIELLRSAPSPCRRLSR